MTRRRWYSLNNSASVFCGLQTNLLNIKSTADKQTIQVWWEVSFYHALHNLSCSLYYFWATLSTDFSNNWRENIFVIIFRPYQADLELNFFHKSLSVLAAHFTFFIWELFTIPNIVKGKKLLSLYKVAFFVWSERNRWTQVRRNLKKLQSLQRKLKRKVLNWPKMCCNLYIQIYYWSKLYASSIVD